MLTKPVLKKLIDPKTKASEDQLISLKRYVQLRVEYRELDKSLKSDLKKKISPIITDNYKNLIGVVERELYENFYSMNQVNVKYRKKVVKNNYMDYLSVAELKGLNVLKESFIGELDKYDNLTIASACSLAARTGFNMRKWFFQKYKVLPENVAADEVSYTVCRSSIAKIDNILQLRNKVDMKMFDTANTGQIKINYNKIGTLNNGRKNTDNNDRGGR